MTVEKLIVKCKKSKAYTQGVLHGKRSLLEEYQIKSLIGLIKLYDNIIKDLKKIKCKERN